MITVDELKKDAIPPAKWGSLPEAVRQRHHALMTGTEFKGTWFGIAKNEVEGYFIVRRLLRDASKYEVVWSEARDAAAELRAIAEKNEREKRAAARAEWTRKMAEADEAMRKAQKEAES